MPDAYFYINDKEREELFNFLYSNEVYLVADFKYASCKYEIVKTGNEFIETIAKETIGFFAISKFFSIYPLYLEQNRFMVEPAYFVIQKYGGPYFDIGLYRGFAEDAPIKFKCTWLSHYPRYIKLQDQYEEFKATESLKEFFKKTVKFLKSKCKKVKLKDKQYWVSKEVCKEIGLDY